MPGCCSSNTASSVSKSVSYLRALIRPFYSVSDFVPEAAIYSSSSPGLEFPYPHRINSIDPNNTNAAYWSEEDYSEDEPEEGDDEDIRDEPKSDDDGHEPITDAPQDKPVTDTPEDEPRTDSPEEPREAQADQDEAFQRWPSDARNDPPEMQRTRFR
ncbi:hypothetical protein CGCS363_v008677 [Colletotrichum siamense]|uniref:uncharacterized protein n=1 Tax=Colletotrichum siamense TaxID=690259 RepID=UPI001873110F|nr:uncharacterized protein CGCS363_v008677 [Colletotrichum siamense]KAF5496880.1 hypothetical protein CGCS363_v008677 [Colletotrichum siamense]